MKKLLLIAIVSMLTSCFPSSNEPTSTTPAQAPAAIKEPPSRKIAGVELGQDANLQECEKARANGRVEYVLFPETAPCWRRDIYTRAHKLKLAGESMPTFDGKVEVNFGKHVPDSIYDTGEVSVIDGKIEMVILKTLGTDRQQEVFKLLSDKWGVPGEANVEKLQNGFGAQFESIDAFWNLDEFTIYYKGMLDRENGVIWFQSSKSSELSRAATKKNGAETF